MEMQPQAQSTRQTGKSLYTESMHHDACGLGFVARRDGRASREIVEQGLVVLANLNHRGTVNADGMTGDGAGLLVQIPHAFFKRQIPNLPEPGFYAAGTCFFWGDKAEIAQFAKELEKATGQEGQRFIGWRDVPVERDAIGDLAQRVEPEIRQFFIERASGIDQATFERKLYVIRRRVHRIVERFYGPGRFYVSSLSSRTLVYKGLLQGTQVAPYYTDLAAPDFTSALALVHSRFSTNTLGNWALAHPYRYIAHNGEINTLAGNLNWMRARESQFESELFGDDMAKLHPVIEPKVSDSAAFDNALEFLHISGRSLPQAMMTMVPEAWESNHTMSAERRAFYHYSTALMQPWDGPAAIAFTDGRIIGGVLDRNGLRPSRYCVTKDGLVVLASEDGVLPIDPADIDERWRLGPGKMIVVDLERGIIQSDEQAKEEVVSAKPYRQWVFDNAVGINDPASAPYTPKFEVCDLTTRQRVFGYTFEDLRLLIAPMAKTGKEADGSMGTDTPLAVLSERPKRLFDYFHQLFAQVTNPPIDPLRERSVMSLRVSLGREFNLLEDGPQHAARIILASPVISDEDLARLQNMTDPAYKTTTISLLWSADDGAAGLRRALNRLRDDTVKAVQEGASTIVLSDRGVNREQLAIPSLLAVGAVHHQLVRSGLGGNAGIVVETGEVREVHHLATLIAFGALAVNPYIALETVNQLVEAGEVPGSTGHARRHYIDALNKGMLKVISKMGISTVHSYTGSQLFEIIGLGQDVVERFFEGAASRMNGLNLEGIGREAIEHHLLAFDVDQLGSNTLDPGGEYQLRENAAAHQWNQTTIPLLQRAVRTQTHESWEAFSQAANEDSAVRNTLRSLLAFKEATPIPIEEVEPATEIVKRFSTGAMSMGSISKEAHETVAIAMNRMGGRSNSGEGGEDPNRFGRDENGDWRRSAIKQVASGRFGVTADYLINADMLQIKVAQGAKPGEGGQLPGHKVSDDIAKLRYSTPGVGLISPPPHHDIYSIEDLSQLIFDLHMVNREAWVSVKLVAEAGVGTIAAGVAKAKADHITISGFDGGTGAAPQSSIKHAGLPWEIGLAETQQVLVDNGLRSRVRLQTDGMLRTGRDVAIAALLGADEFGFSTAPLVAMGCVMMRVCHLNTCPVGIATQNPELRKRFAGQPEHVINYFFFVAEEVRSIMAQLGFRSVEEMVGRVDMLHRNTAATNWKSRNLDLFALLHAPDPSHDGLHHNKGQDHNTGATFDNRLMPDLIKVIEQDTGATLQLPIYNTDRTVGARISGEVARAHGASGLTNAIKLELTGVAGQSFGAFGARGLHLDLTGTTNDYAGKGLSGAVLSVKPPQNAAYLNRDAIITGNVALYGATSGEAYFAGMAGERFAVRNSGATAVVEGVGDHGCEYMTGGTVLILGTTGRNFAAGMSGGIAYVLEPRRDLRNRMNLEMVGLSALDNNDAEIVGALLKRHDQLTGSAVAGRLLRHWPQGASDFVKIIPNDLKRVLDAATEGNDEDAPESVTEPAAV